jgi:hypothetical protein
LKDLWEYKPEADAWFSRAPFDGSERKNAISFAVNDRVFVGTGKGVTGKKASIYEYIPHDFLGMNDAETNVNIYPNPSTDELYFVNISNSVSHIELLSSDGKIIDQRMVHNQGEFKFNVTDYPNGIYYIHLYTEERGMLSSHRILIQHL